MSDIPDTISDTVAALAVAWEIVKITYDTSKGNFVHANEKGAKELTNAVIKVFTAIREREPIKEDRVKKPPVAKGGGIDRLRGNS